MSSATFFFFVLPWLVQGILADSCADSTLICGNQTLDIRYPFFSNTSSDCRQGIYHIQCINLTPLIQLPGQEFMYPVFKILYTEKTLIIHDVKLSLSPYPWGPNCLFFYDFRLAPIPQVNVTQLSLLMSSSGSSSFFDCWSSKDYGSSVHSSVFARFYNGSSSSSCENYSLYYTNELESSRGLNDGECLSSGSDFLWFDWKLSFGVEGGGFSLLSAGFSRSWLEPDCFSCQIKGPDCNTSHRKSPCECTEKCPEINSGKKRKRNFIIAASAIGASGGLIVACFFLCFLWNRHNRLQHQPPSTPLMRNHSPEPSSFRKWEHSINYPTHVFSYSELQEATNSFDISQEIGDGGFGTVYKGKLHDGRIVAVKRLYDNHCKRVEQFINEVAILSRLHHQNLVTLYGCTSHHSPELLLVYEFVPNGTVADHLHGIRAPERALTWPLRLNIAIETAQALAYLHAIDPPIIHRDVKTNNILLDGDFHVKVADFGLSRLFPVHATHVSTAPQGTPGYLDPEYHQCYQLTDKSDVYSFGVVLVELISSKQAVDITRHRTEINLANMALNKIRNKEMEQLMDIELGYQSDSEMERMITLVAELAFRCLQTDKEMRPPIKEVLEELKEIEKIHIHDMKVNQQKVLEVDIQNHSVAARLMTNSKVLVSPNSVTEKWVSSASTLSIDSSGTS